MRLGERNPREVILALRIEQRQVADRAEVELPLGEPHGLPRRSFRERLGSENARIVVERMQRVRDVLEREEDGLAVVCRRLVEGRDRRAPLGVERAAAEERLQQACADAPEARAGEEVAQLQCLGAEAARQRDLRIKIRGRDADVRAGLMQQRLGRQDVRALVDERGRHADRDFLRQRQRGELEPRQLRFARQTAGERGELMPRAGEIALEHRQRRLRLRKLRLLGEHVGARHGAELELALHDGELTLLRGDDLVGGRDLRAQRRFANGRGHDVRRQREMGAFELILLVIDEGGEPLDLAASAAEHVERIRHADIRVVEREQAGAEAGGPELGTGDLFPRHRRNSVYGRIKQFAAARGQVFLRDPQRRLCGGERRVVRDCALDQRIERVGAVQRPPLGRQVCAVLHVLRRATEARSRDGRVRQRRLGVAVRLRRRGALEIGPDHAARKDGHRAYRGKMTESDHDILVA